MSRQPRSTASRTDGPQRKIRLELERAAVDKDIGIPAIVDSMQPAD